MKEVLIREAKHSDLSAIIKLLADDPLGANREDSTMPPNTLYVEAWERMISNDYCTVYIVEDESKVIGVAQIDYLQCLTYQGGLRAQIEGVRVHKEYRNRGVGKRLFRFLIEETKRRGCHLIRKRRINYILS